MTSILTRDLLMNILLGLAALVIVMMSSINPAQDDATKQIQAGNIAAYIAWPDGDIDVDLWVSGPEMPRLAIATNLAKCGLFCAMISARTTMALRSTMKRPLREECRMETIASMFDASVAVRLCRSMLRLKYERASGELIWKGVVVLAYEKQEKTAIAWTMQNGVVVRDSLNSVTKELVK